MRLLSHVARRRDEGSELKTPGPTLLPSARSSTPPTPEGQLFGALRFLRSQTLVDNELVETIDTAAYEGNPNECWLLAAARGT